MTHSIILPFLVVLLGSLFLTSDCRGQCAFLQHHGSPKPYRLASCSRQYSIPPGRVEDIDEWVRLSSESIKRFTGTSLLEGLGLDSVQDVHTNERFAVLSHGNQTDPIYNYFNKAALLQFQWPESEVYSLPSRYSAPDGFLREDRAEMMKTVEDQDVRTIPIAIRQTKDGEFFQLTNVTLWNVYDDEGTRLGQTACFDRNYITSLPKLSVKA